MAKKQKQKTPYGSIPRPGQWQYVTTKVLSTTTKPEEVTSTMKENTFTPSRVRTHLKEAREQDAMIVPTLDFAQGGRMTFLKEAGISSPFVRVDEPTSPHDFTKKGVTIPAGNFMRLLDAGPRVGSLAADDEVVEPPSPESEDGQEMVLSEHEDSLLDLTTAPKKKSTPAFSFGAPMTTAPIRKKKSPPAFDFGKKKT